VTDAPSVKTSTSLPTREQGVDVGKEIVGCEHSTVIRTTGLIRTVLGTAARTRRETAPPLPRRQPPEWSTSARASE
jgi:hypothetical protein